MLSREERIEKMINLLTDNTRQLIMTVRELNTDELLSFMQRDNMIICNDLFNYIFTFYCGQKKVKTTNYKTAQINGIEIFLN